MPQNPTIRTTKITQRKHPSPTHSVLHTLTYLRIAKELSSLLKPLIGKLKHHVRNSSDFASSIIHELLQTDEVKVSFDVVSLFAKVPIQLALNIVKQHLPSDPELNQRTGLSTTDLIKRREICLNSTKFTFVENTTNKFLEQQWAPRLISSGKLSHGKH